MKKLFKSLFYSLVFCLAMLVSFTSCDKEDDDYSAAKDAKALIMGKTWTVVTCRSEKNNDAFEPLLKMVFTKFKHEYVFGEANTFTGTITAMDMGGFATPYTGAWSLESDGKTLILRGETGTIEKLTATEFELSFSQGDFVSMKINHGDVAETGRVTMVMEAK